jgi:hypothetical protein
MKTETKNVSVDLIRFEVSVQFVPNQNLKCLTRLERSGLFVQDSSSSDLRPRVEDSTGGSSHLTLSL